MKAVPQGRPSAFCASAMFYVNKTSAEIARDAASGGGILFWRLFPVFPWFLLTRRG
jgi:hypothetical protein